MPTVEGHWSPTEEQKKIMLKDRQDVESWLRYRNGEEAQWKRNAAKWNQLSHDDTDDDIANFVVPISRMITHTGIVSMRQNLPEIKVIPGHVDDQAIANNIEDASAHVDRMCNMEAELDQAIVEYGVLGSMVVEDYYEIPYRVEHKEILDDKGTPTGRYSELIRRDWNRSKLGTRFIGLWNCAFDHSARNVREIKGSMHKERISVDEFNTRYVNVPDSGLVSTYMNTKHVKPGSHCFINNEGNLEREANEEDKKITLVHIQRENGFYTTYAQGIIIWHVPISALHAHGKISLSLIPNHHKFDKNGKTHSLYGAGDPELLEDMDDLINAMTNQFITNYARKNQYVIGVEGDGAIDVTDMDIEIGKIISGKVNVQSLGATDLPEFQQFKEAVEEWAIQITKKNFKRLQGETAQTATEIQLKKRSEETGMLYQIKVMESGGLKEHYKKRISDILEYLTKEEWQDVTGEDLANLKEMTGKDFPTEDIRYNKKTRKPIAIRFQEKFRTRGRVFEEVFIKGKRHIDGLREVMDMKGEDGFLPAAKEYLYTRDYALRRAVPDLIIIGKSMLGEDKAAEIAGVSEFVGVINASASLDPTVMEKIDMFKVIGTAADAMNRKEEDYKVDEVINEDDAKINDGFDQLESLITNVQPPPTSQALPAQGLPTRQEGTPELATAI